jgi:PAS domain S-box-containing protein/putative nucleotidyltransferase with HDIG domain
VAERLAAIVSGSTDAIVSSDLNNIITSWNHGAEHLLGYLSQEAIGKSLDFLVPLDRLQEENLIFQKALKGEWTGTYESDLISKNKQRIAISTTVSPIFDTNGNVIGTSRIARDISTQKKAQHELIIANQEKAKRAAELLFANEEKAKRVAELEIIHEKLQDSLMETIVLARELVELRDPYTARHEKYVGELARAIGEQLGFDADRQQGLRIAGYLHDIGKIIIPAEILSKPGKISAEEYALVKNHVKAGYNLLKQINFPWNISRPVLEHHERLDGGGYPNGLTGDQISMEGRILAVADVVEAMSAYRPYRPALGVEVALAEIERGRGSIYDEKVVDACLALFREKGYKINMEDH